MKITWEGEEIELDGTEIADALERRRAFGGEIRGGRMYVVAHAGELVLSGELMRRLREFFGVRFPPDPKS